MANLTRVCTWLEQEFIDRAGPHSRAAVWNGRGGADALIAVGRGQADIGLMTPAAFATMALEGIGPFAGAPLPDLRALGVLPQNDRLVPIVGDEIGITSFADIREQQPALRIAACPDDGVNFVGYATERLMSASGIDRATLESWGGAYVVDERPLPCLQRYIDGEVDAVIMEAICAPLWEEAFDRRPTVLLEAESGALVQLQEELGWPSRPVPEGWWSAKPDPIPALDFSDFLVLVRADMPEDVAHVLTWCLFETRTALQSQYEHLPSNRSGLTHPLDPKSMADVPIPLHPGAERYLRDANS